MITLYHGSTVIVDKPLANVGRRNLDFGLGFYVTNLREQAEKWAQLLTERKSRYGIPQLSIYELDDEAARLSGCHWLHFEDYSLEWLDYVVGCRRGEQLWHPYDIVEGGVANDNVIDTVDDYAMGIITAEQALGQLKYKKVNHQMCLINQDIIDRFLHFKESIALSREEGIR